MVKLIMKEENVVEKTPFDELAVYESTWVNSINGSYHPDARVNGYGSIKPYPTVKELSRVSGLDKKLIKPLVAEATKDDRIDYIYFRRLNSKIRRFKKEKGIRLRDGDKPLSRELTKVFLETIRQGKTDLIFCNSFTLAQLRCIAESEEGLF